MGTTCAGAITTSGKTFHVRTMRSSGKACQIVGDNMTNTNIFSDLPSKSLSKREPFRKIREKRRRLFDERKPFKYGVFPKIQTPPIYVPSGDDTWKETTNCEF
jgi:hypothetical protein